MDMPTNIIQMAYCIKHIVEQLKILLEIFLLSIIIIRLEIKQKKNLILMVADILIRPTPIQVV